ncbi:hypothetical protein AQUSIP_05610 [Aquicella siphonis]|uniref:Surface antigen domain-containing protein n=1 Tax=Aquicella siphonis TaxID=254247 RepID=A0A5E4PFW0_9COXI|nr:RT0821/Lpp0805 family surface protein [Aquicella siphonis]VVC75273.1 hypothetical protein AQUSIP_05610 [Aquicella siphonis]
MKTTTKISILCLFFCLVGLSAWAVNQAFMSNSAMSYFTKEDWQIFNKTQANVLDKTKDGDKTSWQNPGTGAFGYMIPSDTHKENGMTCRKLFFFNTANQIQGEGTYKFCKTNNKWMIY